MDHHSPLTIINNYVSVGISDKFYLFSEREIFRLTSSVEGNTTNIILTDFLVSKYEIQLINKFIYRHENCYQ